MGITLKLIILFCGLAFVATIIYLLIKRKINERNSLLWLVGALVILVLSALPETVDIVASLAGVEYPPTLLFLFSIMVILFITLFHSIQISALQERIRELTQCLAVYKEVCMTKEAKEEDSYDKLNESDKHSKHPEI